MSSSKKPQPRFFCASEYWSRELMWSFRGRGFAWSAWSMEDLCVYHWKPVDLSTYRRGCPDIVVISGLSTSWVAATDWEKEECYRGSDRLYSRNGRSRPIKSLPSIHFPQHSLLQLWIWWRTIQHSLTLLFTTGSSIMFITRFLTGLRRCMSLRYFTTVLLCDCVSASFEHASRRRFVPTF